MGSAALLAERLLLSVASGPAHAPPKDCAKTSSRDARQNAGAILADLALDRNERIDLNSEQQVLFCGQEFQGGFRLVCPAHGCRHLHLRADVVTLKL